MLMVVVVFVVVEWFLLCTESLHELAFLCHPGKTWDPSVNGIGIIIRVQTVYVVF